MSSERITPDEYIEWLAEIGRQVEEMTIPDFEELLERSSLGSPTSRHLQELGLAVIRQIDERNRALNEKAEKIEALARLLAAQSEEARYGTKADPEGYWDWLTDGGRDFWRLKAREVLDFLTDQSN